MPPKKQQLDQIVWQWAEFTEPSSVTQDHVCTAYRLKLKPCKLKVCRRNCKGNPRCVNALGEGKWFTEIPDTYWYEIEDPLNERRVPGTFAGLKNLGATCYVNTLLQVWFHNPEIRKAVFSWKQKYDQQTLYKLNQDLATLTATSHPEELEKLLTPHNICAHLQNVFALMQFSKRRYIDPTPFINSLGLDAALQQDSQEFSKLFMSLLEDTLSHYHSDEGMMFTQQFLGQYQYTTRCSSCGSGSKRPSDFYELDLNIKGHKNLYECIAEFLKVEKLEGDNRYMCSACNSKQDATRYIQLCQLPKVLNLQLLRFIFDRQTGQKKKLNTFIEFPEVIDLSKYLGKEGDSVVYHLAAVLIHRGPSAYSGHYVAHVKDVQSKVWYKFNDEQIEKMSGKNLQLGTEDELEGKGPKKPKSSKGFHASRNAYMLVYHQQQKPVTNTAIPEPVSSTQPFPIKGALEEKMCHATNNGDIVSKPVSLSVISSVNDTGGNKTDSGTAGCLGDGGSHGDASGQNINDGFDVSLLPIRVQKYLEWDNNQFDEWLSEMTNIRKQNVLKGKERQAEVLELFEKLQWKDGGDYTWVKSDWLSKWMTSDDSVSVPPLDCEGLLCSHGKLDPDKVPKVKCISKEAADILHSKYGGDNSVNSTSLCTQCVMERCQVIRTKTRMAEDSRAITAFNKLKEEQLSKEKCYWVGKASLRSWKRLALEQLEDIEPTINSNGRVEGGGEETEVEIKTNDTTADNSSNQNVTNGSITSQTASSSDKAAGDSKCESVVPANEPNEENQSDTLQFNEDLLCDDHSNLSIESSCRRLVTEQIWNRLKWYFPKAPEFSQEAEECQNCVQLLQEDIANKARYKALANEQKSLLLDLYLDKKRPSWGSAGVNEVNIVSSEFVEMWRKFIRDPQKSPPPEVTSNRSLLCDHGGFLYDPGTLGLDTSTQRMSMIFPSEWSVIKKYVKADIEIHIVRVQESTGHVTFIVTPDVCEECQKARQSDELKSKLNYKDAIIFIRKLPSDGQHTGIVITDDQSTVLPDKHNHINGDNDKDFLEEYSKNPEFGPPPDKMIKLDPSIASIRRSTRHRKVRGEKEITVSSSHSLRDLKLKIMESFSVAPFDQNLTLNGRALNGDQSTLESLSIFPGDTIYLKADEPLEDPTFLEDVSKTSHPEEGFKGTGLLSRC